MKPVLDAFLEQSNLEICKNGLVSTKRAGIVAVVHDPSDLATPRWVVRLSPLDGPHRAAEFIHAFKPLNKSYLPTMKDDAIFKHGSLNYVVETYEYVGPRSQDEESSALPERDRLKSDLYSFWFESKKQGKQEHKESLTYVRNILSGLIDLHKMGWYHHDLSMENIAVHGDRCVLIDFEGTMFVPFGRDPYVSRKSVGPVKGQFAPPELEKGLKDVFVVPADVDVWSIGVIVYAICTGFFPFDTYTETAFNPVSRQMLFNDLKYWGFEEFLTVHRPSDLESIREIPYLLDLLSNIFVVYEQERVDGRLVFRSNDGRTRLSMTEVGNHAFWNGFSEHGDVRERILDGLHFSF